MTNRILMAQIGSAHGIRGEVRVKAFTDDPMALADYKTLHSDNGDAFKIGSLRPAKGQMLVARFTGIDDRARAEALNGVKLYVDRAQFPEPDEDEFYQADLIGCAAIDESGNPVGTVLAVVNFGAGDLLELKLTDNTTLLVPFSEIHVPDVDIANRRVVVSSLDSLLPEADGDEDGGGDEDV